MPLSCVFDRTIFTDSTGLAGRWANHLCFWLSGLWFAVLPLGWRILVSSRLNAVDDRYADQTENAYSDPLIRHVQQVGTDRQADNQYDVAYDVNPK